MSFNARWQKRISSNFLPAAVKLHVADFVWMAIRFPRLPQSQTSTFLYLTSEWGRVDGTRSVIRLWSVTTIRDSGVRGFRVNLPFTETASNRIVDWGGGVPFWLQKGLTGRN